MSYLALAGSRRFVATAWLLTLVASGAVFGAAPPPDAAIDTVSAPPEPPAPPAPPAAPAAPPRIADCSPPVAGRVAIDGSADAKQFLDALVARYGLVVQHAERINGPQMDFHATCADLGEVLGALAKDSGAALERGEKKGVWRVVAVRNGAQIQQLRALAGRLEYAEKRESWKQTLRSITALSVPGKAGERQADVEDEYHDLGNTAMKEKEYPLAETYYRKRLKELERTGANDDANYAIAVSNVADALAYQDDFARAEPLYTRALEIMQKHPGPLSQPNRVVILGTLSDYALGQKRLADAEAYNERMWQVLADPERAQWNNLDSALDFGSQVEGEFGRLGAEADRFKHYSRALELKVAQVGPDHKDVVELRNRVIFEAQKRGDSERAAELDEQQLAAAEHRGERTGTDAVVTLYRLLALDAHLHRMDRMIAHWRTMIEVRRSLLGESSKHVAAAQRDLAALYRLDRQWAPAREAERAAAAIAAQDDAALLKKLDPDVRYAMEYDPALVGWCARVALQRQTLKTPARQLIPPAPPLPPNLFFDLPDPSDVGDVPKDAAGQAGLLEQSAECNAEFANYAAGELEIALQLRTSANGSKDPAAQATARRLLELYEAAGDKDKAERVRALVRTEM